MRWQRIDVIATILPLARAPTRTHTAGGSVQTSNLLKTHWLEKIEIEPPKIQLDERLWNELVKRCQVNENLLATRALTQFIFK